MTYKLKIGGYPEADLQVNEDASFEGVSYDNKRFLKGKITETGNGQFLLDLKSDPIPGQTHSMNTATSLDPVVKAQGKKTDDGYKFQSKDKVIEFIKQS